ncbi:hypothetical protein BO86DRAFT_395754 [Aspergillus japonicus CBS 114.51]|uniref:Uncharacterized protein n=1 Tax=Aspergillus japonicus CBS 114.51 TaxID=1448312 RepID=A0A8T8XEB5_ASPJA|nr:hypothetical protein BO86DRAFT_395754 [Aspergillus japonicus CBS 114.51]RAH86318.1 hypothetical protein BO86DRAFT_395754 [Aspergillus japonicus CBS 114.51]
MEQSEKSANLTRSIQTGLDAIQKAIDALQHIMGAFSRLETDLAQVAKKLDFVKGNVAQGGKIKLKRAFILFDEAGASWAKVCDLAQQFQQHGLIKEIDPEKLADENSEIRQHLEILSANFGASDCTDASKILFNDGGDLRIPSDGPGLLDPWHRMPKTISILHQYRKEKRIFVCKEGTGVHHLKAGEIQQSVSVDGESICRAITPGSKPADS